MLEPINTNESATAHKHFVERENKISYWVPQQKKFLEMRLLQICKMPPPQTYQKWPQICSANFGAEFGGFGTLWCGSARVCAIKTSPDTNSQFPNCSSTLVHKHRTPYLCVCAIKSDRRLKLIVSFLLPAFPSN